MNDKLLIALIAAGSSLLGVSVSSAISYILSTRTERVKSRHAAADFLRHKIDVLEKLKYDLIEFGTKKHSIAKVKENVAAEVAAALEDTFNACSRIIYKGGHFLPANRREALLSKNKLIRNTIANARAAHYGLKNSNSNPSDLPKVIDEMYSFIDEVTQVIDDQLNSSTDRVQKLYGIT